MSNLTCIRCGGTGYYENNAFTYECDLCGQHVPYALTVKQLRDRLSSLPDHYIVMVVTCTKEPGVHLENMCGMAINGEGVQLHAESFQIKLDAEDE